MWVRSSMCACLVTWSCYQMIAKPGNKTFLTWPMYIHPSVWPNHTIRHRITWSTLFQLMTCCLVAPSHYLSQFSIKGVLWYPQTNSTGNSQDIVLQIEFEKKNTFLKLTSNLQGATVIKVWTRLSDRVLTFTIYPELPHNHAPVPPFTNMV